MKKSWVLLFLAAALFFSCSAALASPIDGTWKVESGWIMRYDAAGMLDTDSVSHGEFKIQMVEDGEVYTMVFNDGVGVTWQWTNSISYGNELKSWSGLTKVAEEFYIFEEHIAPPDARATMTAIDVYLADSATLQIRNTHFDGQVDSPTSYVIIFKRVNDDPPPSR